MDVPLGNRERQIVEAVYRLGKASVSEVRELLPDPPTYSAVRAMLNLLVEKKVLTSRPEGKRYVYRPVTPRGKMGRTVLRRLVSNFFSGQPVDAIAAILDGSVGQLTSDDLARIRNLINEAEGKS